MEGGGRKDGSCGLPLEEYLGSKRSGPIELKAGRADIRKRSCAARIRHSTVRGSGLDSCIGVLLPSGPSTLNPPPSTPTAAFGRNRNTQHATCNAQHAMNQRKGPSLLLSSPSTSFLNLLCMLHVGCCMLSVRVFATQETRLLRTKTLTPSFSLSPRPSPKEPRHRPLGTGHRSKQPA